LTRCDRRTHVPPSRRVCATYSEVIRGYLPLAPRVVYTYTTSRMPSGNAEEERSTPSQPTLSLAICFISAYFLNSLGGGSSSNSSRCRNYPTHTIHMELRGWGGYTGELIYPVVLIPKHEPGNFNLILSRPYRHFRDSRRRRCCQHRARCQPIANRNCAKLVRV
jgi:hypothetical protein